MAASFADVVANCFSEPVLVVGELPNGKCFDVHDTHFFVGFDDPVSNDAIIALRAPRSIGAPGP